MWQGTRAYIVGKEDLGVEGRESKIVSKDEGDCGFAPVIVILFSEFWRSVVLVNKFIRNKSISSWNWARLKRVNDLELNWVLIITLK